MWSIGEIADALAAGLLLESRRLDAEQAVYGLDALDELAVQPVLAHSLADVGYGVFREQRYPAFRRQRNASEGERCDLVLTPNGQPLATPEAPPTLFDPADAVALEDAFWMEIKVVAQFTTEGPNHRYSSQLLGEASRDVAKLSKEPGINHAGLLIVQFAQDEHVADHDLNVWQTRCVERSLLIGDPALRRVPVGDRLGNALCNLALYPVWHREWNCTTLRNIG